MLHYSSVIDPGPMYSEILNRVYESQLNDEFSDHEGGLKVLNRLMIEIFGEIG